MTIVPHSRSLTTHEAEVVLDWLKWHHGRFDFSTTPPQFIFDYPEDAILFRLIFSI